MGLDGVELILEWEEIFGIKIPDEAAAMMRTPRDATDYILGRVESGPAKECLRQRTFFRLRHGLRRACRPFSVHVGPRTPLRAIVAHRDWPRAWSVVRSGPGRGGWPEIEPFACWFSFRRRTVGDLVQELCVLDDRSARRGGEPWTRETVSFEVRRIVEYMVGARFFAEDDRFVQDIGIN